MNRIGKSAVIDRRPTVIVALAAAITLAFGLPASQASAAQSVAASPNWTGIWLRQGSFNFDPSVPPEQSPNPPYRPDWMAKYRAGLDLMKKGQAPADPTAGCVPGGMPRIMNMVYPMEILQTPGQVTIIAEWMSQVRRIYTDGRKLPTADMLDPTYNGYSVGRWEGKTLIVDTVGLRDDTVFDQTGVRHSAQMTIHEQFREVSPGALELMLTVNDPVAFEKPWTVKKTFKRAEKGEQMMEYVCQENNRNPIDANGVVQTILKGSN